jgi:hypothetical protein
MPGRSSRHTSVAPHGVHHDPLSSATDSILCDDDSNRFSVVSCLIPASVSVAARWETIVICCTKEKTNEECVCLHLHVIAYDYST